MIDDSSPICARSRPDRTIKVLLVDDSALARAALVQALAGCPRIHVAGQAESALDGFALASTLQPDLVITDLQMPGGDGFQLVQLLRRTYPAMHSVVVSAQDSPACQLVSLQHGADAFISKRRLLDEFPRLLIRLFPDTAELPTATCNP